MRKTMLLGVIGLWLGCGAEAPRDPEASGGSPLSGGKADGAGIGGDPVPEDDETLQYLAQHGFGGIAFMDGCVSKLDGGPTLEGDELPVGGGRFLECTTSQRVDRATMGMLGDSGQTWCGLGEVTTFKAGGDGRLVVQVTARPDGAPWTLTATHEGEEIKIAQVEALGIARVWPLWINASYRTVSMKKDPAAGDCSDLFP